MLAVQRLRSMSRAGIQEVSVEVQFKGRNYSKKYRSFRIFIYILFGLFTAFFSIMTLINIVRGTFS